MAEYDLAAIRADELALLATPLERLYRRCFAGPPWHEEEATLAAFAHRLAAHLAMPGAHGILIRHAQAVVGVVYGWPAAAKTPENEFYARVDSAVDPAEHHRLRAPALEVAELMVDPDHQRRGLGRELLTQFAEPHPRAWSCTHPDAPARRLYESAGWAVLGACTNGYGTPLVVMSRTG